MRTVWLLAAAGMMLVGCGSNTGGASSLPSGCQLPLVHVSGTAMVPTINDGDLLCTTPVTTSPTRGEIVVMHPPSNLSEVFVKRVIGLPGDIIEVDGDHNPTDVLIKIGGTGPWRVLNEPYLPQPWTTLNDCCNADGTASSSPMPLTLPASNYFMLGDNRNFSSDSRSFGLVPRPLIVAVVTSDRSNAAMYSALPSLAP